MKNITAPLFILAIHWCIAALCMQVRCLYAGLAPARLFAGSHGRAQSTADTGGSRDARLRRLPNSRRPGPRRQRGGYQAENQLKIETFGQGRQEMVGYDELTKLAKMAQKSLSLPEEELVSFVKGGAVRAYKAGDDTRKNEEVSAEFNPQTKQLRLLVRKEVVTTVVDKSKQCTPEIGKAAVGQIVDIEINDLNTERAITAAYSALKDLVGAEWNKQNSLAVKTKYQELKDKCVPVKVVSTESGTVKVSLANEIEGSLPKQEQLNENYTVGSEIVVFVKELKEESGVSELIVSRSNAGLIAYAMRRHIPEVDAGNIEVKAVARIPGKRSRAAVWSKDFSPTERCEKRADKLTADLGGEQVDFVEWYADTKAYIVSALKVEARQVHLIESEKQALVEVFSDSAEQAIDANGETLNLAQQLTGYKIEVKLVARDNEAGIPGV